MTSLGHSNVSASVSQLLSWGHPFHEVCNLFCEGSIIGPRWGYQPILPNLKYSCVAIYCSPSSWSIFLHFARPRLAQVCLLVLKDNRLRGIVVRVLVKMGPILKKLLFGLVYRISWHIHACQLRLRWVQYKRVNGIFRTSILLKARRSGMSDLIRIWNPCLTGRRRQWNKVERNLESWRKGSSFINMQERSTHAASRRATHLRD